MFTNYTNVPDKQVKQNIKANKKKLTQKSLLLLSNLFKALTSLLGGSFHHKIKVHLYAFYIQMKKTKEN